MKDDEDEQGHLTMSVGTVNKRKVTIEQQTVLWKCLRGK